MNKAVNATALSWEIIEKPIYANNQQLSTHKAIFRNDNGTLLNVAKTSYTPTSNARFLDVVHCMSDITGFPVKCFDTFQGGRKVLAFLECTDPIKVCGYDFDSYMLIGNSHDSSTGFFIGNSNKMIRCQNRFSKMFRQLQVNHTRNHDARIDQLLRYFEQYRKEEKKIFETYERFANVKIDESISQALIERLANMNEEERLGSVHVSTRKANIIDGLHVSIDREMVSLGDNLFGLFNGITHYTTHARRTKELVFCNALGGLNTINQQAYKFCEALL